MARQQPEFVSAMVAGVRLIEVASAGGGRRYAITTLRNDDRREFDDRAAAQAVFEAEIEASRADPVVGPYVR
jgi:hypothetical protein